MIPKHPMYQRFHELLEEIEQDFLRKNHDYAGEDPYSSFKDFGWRGVVVRIGDKFNRIKNFAKYVTLKVKDESIVDTLKDLAVYAIITIIIFELENNEKN